MPNLAALARPLLASIAGLSLAGASLHAIAQTSPAPADLAAPVATTEPAAQASAPAPPQGRGVGGFQGGGRQGGFGQNAAGQNPAAEGAAPGQAQAGQGRGQAGGQRGQGFGPQASAGPIPARGAAPAATANDELAQAFRAEVSAITGETGHSKALLVENLGWMRSTRTVTVGDEYKQGWIITALTSSSAVLHKAGSPDKQIDLTRWSGPAAPRAARAVASNQATRVSIGTLGMPSGDAIAVAGAQPASAAQSQAAPGQIGGSRGAAGQNANGGRGASPAADDNPQTFNFGPPGAQTQLDVAFAPPPE